MRNLMYDIYALGFKTLVQNIINSNFEVKLDYYTYY